MTWRETTPNGVWDGEEDFTLHSRHRIHSPSSAVLSQVPLILSPTDVPKSLFLPHSESRRSLDPSRSRKRPINLPYHRTWGPGSIWLSPKNAFLSALASLRDENIEFPQCACNCSKEDGNLVSELRRPSVPYRNPQQYELAAVFF